MKDFEHIRFVTVWLFAIPYKPMIKKNNKCTGIHVSLLFEKKNQISWFVPSLNIMILQKLEQILRDKKALLSFCQSES